MDDNANQKQNIEKTDKERLELIEKKVDIQKKRIDIKKEQLSIAKMHSDGKKEELNLEEKKLILEAKQLENLMAEYEYLNASQLAKTELDKICCDKLFMLNFILTSRTIDAERTVVGGEPFYVPLLEEKNKQIALSKLMELIKSL